MSTAPVMLGCIPKDAAARARIAEATGIACEPYTGSVEGTCHDCGCGVWVGPRQAAALAAGPGPLVYCLPCAAALMYRWGGGDVRHLGNPERPGE